MKKRFLQPYECFGRVFKTRLWASSGCWGWFHEAKAQGLVCEDTLGAAVLKGLSLNPEKGAPQPRIWEFGNGLGLVNSIGLENPGIQGFAENHLNKIHLSESDVPLWVNVYGKSIQEYVELVKRLVELFDKDPRSKKFAGFEVNVSCPNVERGGLEFAADIRIYSELLEKIKLAVDKYPVLVKLSAAETVVGVLEKALKVSELSLGGLTLCNTLPATVPSGFLGRGAGGLSGPTLKLQSLRLLGAVKNKFPDLPCVASGGYASVRDFDDALNSGADFIQIGSALLGDPFLFHKLKRLN